MKLLTMTTLVATLSWFFVTPTFAKPELFGIIEMNVEYSNGFGEERSTDMDSGDSLIGVKGLENLDDGLRLAYFVTIGVDSEGKEGGAEIVDASVAVNSRTYGTITLGLFESFTRIQSARTVDIFEAGDSQGTTFDGRYDNASSYTSPTWGGFKFGVTIASDGPQGRKDVDVSEYVLVYAGDTYYMTAVHIDDAKVDVQNTFGAIKTTFGGDTTVSIGAESVEKNEGKDPINAVIFALQYDSGKNSYKFGYQDRDLEGTTSTVEYSRTLGKDTTFNVNYQVIDSLKPNEDTDVLSAGIRRDF